MKNDKDNIKTPALAPCTLCWGNNNYEVNLLKVKTDLCVLFVNRLFSVFESKLDLILPVCSAFPFRSTSATVGCSDVHNPELVHRQIWKCKTLKVHHRNLILVSQSEWREYFWTSVGNREHKHLNNSAWQIQELGAWWLSAVPDRHEWNLVISRVF